MTAIIATLLRFMRKHYIPVILLAALAFQTARIEGFLFFDGLKAKAEKAIKERNECRTASQAAAEATKAMREAERKEYQEKADHAEQEHKQALNDVRAATSRYIAANRVQPPRHISAPAAVDQASDTAEPSPVPSGAFVAITDADMQTCSAATAYAVSAHDYLMSIGN